LDFLRFQLLKDPEEAMSRLSPVDLRDHLLERFKIRPAMAEEIAKEAILWMQREAQAGLRKKCEEIGLDYDKMRAQDLANQRAQAMREEHSDE